MGASGLGLLGQGNQFLLIITGIGSVGMVNSMMQQVSAYREKGDLESERNVKGTTFISQCICLAIMVTALLFALDYTTQFLFSDSGKEYKLLLALIIITAPLNVWASSYLEGFFTAYHRFDLYVIASSIVTIVGLLFFVPAIYYWGVAGGLTSIAVSEILLFLFFLYYALKIEKIREIFVFRFSFPKFKELFTDGLINLTCGSLTVLLSLLIRQIIISQKGEFENGIYQFSTSLTAYYLPFITNMLWAQYFPMISAKGITDETKNLISNTLLFITLTISFILGGLLIFPELIIRILASKEFIVAQKYLAIQFVGDFWYILFFVFTVLLLAVRSTKKYLVMWLAFLALQYALVQALSNFRDLEGIMAAYAISCATMGLISLYLFANLIGISKNTTKIGINIFLSFIFVCAQAALTYADAHFIYRILLLALWAATVAWPNRKAF